MATFIYRLTFLDVVGVSLSNEIVNRGTLTSLRAAYRVGYKKHVAFSVEVFLYHPSQNKLLFKSRVYRCCSLARFSQLVSNFRKDCISIYQRLI